LGSGWSRPGRPLPQAPATGPEWWTPEGRIGSVHGSGTTLQPAFFFGPGRGDPVPVRGRHHVCARGEPWSWRVRTPLGGHLALNPARAIAEHPSPRTGAFRTGSWVNGSACRKSLDWFVWGEGSNVADPVTRQATWRLGSRWLAVPVPVPVPVRSWPGRGQRPLNRCESCGRCSPSAPPPASSRPYRWATITACSRSLTPSLV
jgi:hypothetical protein